MGVYPNENIKRKGGWVRYGDGGKAILEDFLTPLTKLGLGLHAKNLYNDYVYFWRWALWKVVENNKQGIVSFITASSYLRGPGFAAMRQHMREAFDDIWIIDLEGDNLGARKSENVFQIQSPVAIAICVRYANEKQNTKAIVKYTRIEGTRDEKLGKLNCIKKIDDLSWRDCLTGKTDPFLPTSKANFWQYPLLTDIYPWQENGIQFKRTWPIGENKELLEKRWQVLLNALPDKRGSLLRETEARKASKNVTNFDDTVLPAITKLSKDAKPYSIIRYAYRSFDRQWAINDARLTDRPRPDLQRAHSIHQLYLLSFLTNVLGEGPSAVVTNLIPDLDSFRGSNGAKHIIPLWQQNDGDNPNLTNGILDELSEKYGLSVSAEDFFAYSYSILFSPLYVKRFWEELTIPGVHLPITKDVTLFKQSVNLGRKIIWLHTFGERFVPPGEKQGRVPQGKTRCKVGVPSTNEDFPESFHYVEATQELFVGKGVFNNVRPEVWQFSISGLQVVKSWLGYRMKKRSGKKSSVLDDIRPEVWTLDNELLDLLWVLDNTIDLLPEINQNFENVIHSNTFVADSLPKPTSAEQHSKTNLTLFDFSGIELESYEENDEE